MQTIQLTEQQLTVIMDSQSKDGVVAYKIGDYVFVGYGFNPSDKNTRKFEAKDFSQWMREIEFEKINNGAVH